MKDAVATAVTGWSAGRSRARDIVRALETPVSLFEANLDAQPGIVAASSRKLLERLRTLFLRIDDSSGRLQNITVRIVDLNVRASQAAIARRQLDEAVLARWIVNFNKADSAGTPEIYLDTYLGVLTDKGLRAAKKALDTWERKWEKEREEDTSPYARYRYKPWSLGQLQEQHAMLTGDVDARVSALLNGSPDKRWRRCSCWRTSAASARPVISWNALSAKGNSLSGVPTTSGCRPPTRSTGSSRTAERRK